MDIRQEILAALNRTGRTRADLIRETGLCRESVYRFLSGKTDISASMAGTLLEAAKCRITQPRWKDGRG